MSEEKVPRGRPLGQGSLVTLRITEAEETKMRLKWPGPWPLSQVVKALVKEFAGDGQA